MSHQTSPLRGQDGVYRIKVVGNSGTGKSTVSAKLATILGVPYIPLDQIHWKPNWVESTPDEFRATLEARFDASPSGWVVDGNYAAKSDGASDRATDIIWLDPPLLLYFPLLLKRTFGRLFGIGPPCAPGCEETVREVFFSKESIILWCLSHHSVIRRRYTPLIESHGVDLGGRWRRIGGWGYYSSVARWLEDVQASQKSV